MLSERCNFTYVYKYSVDGKWGSELENGSFNGLIGMVERREAEMAAAYLTMTPERETAVDFTVAIDEEVGDLIIRKDFQEQLDFFAYLYLFTFDVWICTLAVVVITSILLYLMVTLKLLQLTLSVNSSRRLIECHL